MRRRRMMLAAVTAAAASFAAGRSAAQEKLTIRLGHVMPPNHFENVAFEQLAADLAKRSNGRIEMKVFPASQLGSEREQTEQLNLGALEMHSSGGALQNYAPQLGIDGGKDFFLRQQGRQPLDDGQMSPLAELRDG